MAERKGKLRIAALADMHVHENRRGEYHDLLADIARKADILVLCGDLTNRGTPGEAEALAEELSAARNLRVLGVLGNHDFESGQQAEVRHILCAAGVTLLEGEPQEIGEIGFAGAKGFCGGFGRNQLAPWGEDMIKQFVRETVDESLALESDLGKLRTPKKVAVLHYAPVPDTVVGEPPEIFPFLGASRLAEPADRFDVDLVFHGHAHRGSHTGKTVKGIPVYNVALPLMQHIKPDEPYCLLEL